MISPTARLMVRVFASKWLARCNFNVVDVQPTAGPNHLDPLNSLKVIIAARWDFEFPLLLAALLLQSKAYHVAKLV